MTTKYVFYDLETSCLSTVGQILNYSFIEVDGGDLTTILSECSGDVKIRPCELLDPNSANIIGYGLKNFSKNEHSEIVSIKRIHEYLTDLCEKNDKIYLIGYNSNSFDLKFLRTTMIRNGLFPYFNQSIVYKDLMHLFMYKSVMKKSNMSHFNTEDFSFTLENISNSILGESVEQTHNSRDDVLLMLTLLKKLIADSNFHISEFDLSLYMPNSFKKSSSKQTTSPRCTLTRVIPEFHKKYAYKCSNTQNLLLLEESKNYSIWVNMNMYSDGIKDKSALVWFNKSNVPFFVSGVTSEDIISDDLRQEAISNYSNVSLSNFFEETTCDIEAFIYRLPVSKISILYEAIWNNDLTRLNSEDDHDLHTLYVRYIINNRNLSNSSVFKAFKDYCEYRYNGEMVIDKNAKNSDKSGYYNLGKHPDYFEMLNSIESRPEGEFNKTVLKYLKSHYSSSPAFKCLNKSISL